MALWRTTCAFALARHRASGSLNPGIDSLCLGLGAWIGLPTVLQPLEKISSLEWVPI